MRFHNGTSIETNFIVTIAVPTTRINVITIFLNYWFLYKVLLNEFIPSDSKK